MEANDESLLKEEQVAELLRMSKRTLQSWRYKGGHTPRFIKVGRSVRYRLGDVKEWLRERRRRSTSDDGMGESAHEDCVHRS